MVCALPVELAAAKEMLEEEYGTEQHNGVIYTLGRIGHHKVAMAGLPGGQTGTVSASVIAWRMMEAFKSIRFGLMVGIGGGVPSCEPSMRLGDVVVSKPNNVHGGVVQYDFGKSTPSGFESTGHLNSPPTILLNAVTELQANHMRGRCKLLPYLVELKCLPTFSREAAGEDVLFDASYNHTGGGDCRNCSKGQQLNRIAREQEVAIHYGTIVSGNQVMRSGVERDKISSELGGVLCFEMEAAGLMNSFPCIVIRGICDYSDSHKNKTWQPYAASTAAACAKELLSLIPPDGVAAARRAELVIASC